MIPLLRNHHSLHIARDWAVGVAVGIALGAPAFACGGGSDSAPAKVSPYTSDPGKTVVVGDGKGGTGYATPTGDACIQLGQTCVKPQETCGADARADVIVDATGKVVETVCYPAAAAPTPVDGNGNVELGKENKGIVAIDGANDGIDVAGDVTSSGNKVTVYGQGPGVSVIGGNVTADGNNFAMRGVTVKKNVTVTGNNAALVLCVVEGDLEIDGNNAVVAECTIFGKLTVKGNNAVLVGNHVAGGIAIEGGNTVCDGNLALQDANANHLVDPGELGAPIACADGKK